MEVLKYSVAGRPGAAVVNAGLEEEEGWVPGGGVPQHPKAGRGCSYPDSGPGYTPRAAPLGVYATLEPARPSGTLRM